MRIKHFYFLILFSCVLNFSCTENTYLKEYSERLKINFPMEMELIHHEVYTEFQDYNRHLIYRVSSNEKNLLLEEIIKNLCDEEIKSEECSGWHRCGDFFSFRNNNKEKGIIINIIFVAKNNMSILNIYETKI